MCHDDNIKSKLHINGIIIQLQSEYEKQLKIEVQILDIVFMLIY